LPSVLTKVRLLNRLPTLDLGGGDYSSFPKPDPSRQAAVRLRRVDSGPSPGSARFDLIPTLTIEVWEAVVSDVWALIDYNFEIAFNLL